MSKIIGDHNKNVDTDTDLTKVSTDLPDSEADAKQMQPEAVVMDLPDVKDIPGQEHIHVMPMGELADTTISSADEEGEEYLVLKMKKMMQILFLKLV